MYAVKFDYTSSNSQINRNWTKNSDILEVKGRRQLGIRYFLENVWILSKGQFTSNYSKMSL